MISLSANSSNATISYANGDGNDTVYGFGSDDRINVTYGYISSSVRSGNNAVLTVGNGRITLVNAASLLSNVITVPGANRYVYGTYNNDSIYNGGYNRVTMNAGDGNDTIYDNRGDYVSINAGWGNDSIYVYDGDSSTIDGGYGNDTINNDWSFNNRIYGGYGNDSIRNYNSTRVSMNAGAGNDTIVNTSSNNSSIAGGYGNDVISLSANSSNVTVGYANGDGNDIVYGFGADDVFNVTSGNVSSSVRSGSRMILSIGYSQVTLVGSSAYQSFNVRRSSSYGRVAEVEESYFDTSNSIVGDSGDNVLTANSTSSTLWGHGGNDTLIGGSSADTFKYTAEDGNVTIQNGESNDVVDISSYSIDDVSSRFTNTGLVISAGTNHSLNIAGSDLTQIQFADGMHTANYNQRRLI